jgi:hypothetical protein
MTAGLFDELQELVMGICDSLHSERKLITRNAIKQALLERGYADTAELELQVPIYINNWRLHSLQEPTEVTIQIEKYRIELQTAQQTIKNLKALLERKNRELANQRNALMQDIRGLLNG